MTSQENILTALSDSMAEAVAKAAAATVLVNARRRMPASGIAFAADLILTADHVIEREEDIQVGLPDGSQLTARLAGRDPGSDLAVLRLERAAAAAAEPAPGAARIGQIALALGRPSMEGIQASFGVVSAIGGPARTGRGGMLESYLRSDATPYPGFSGGPLVDTAGRVLGLNTSGLSMGGSLTIPAALAWKSAASLAEHGSLKRGYLGVRSQPVAINAAQQRLLGREQASGLLVVSVESDSPAEAGGLLVGDILAGLGGMPTADPDDLFAALATAEVGRAAPVEILRGGQPQFLNIVVGERK